MQSEVVPDILPIDVDVSTLPTLEVVEGDRQAGKIMCVMADFYFLRSIRSATFDFVLNPF